MAAFKKTVAVYQQHIQFLADYQKEQEATKVASAR
jgi:hypothetical protein